MSEIIVTSFDPSFRNFGCAQASINIDTLAIDLLDIHLTTTEARAGKSVRKNSDDLRCAKELIATVSKWCQSSSLAIAEVPSGTQSARASWSLGIALAVLGTIPVPLIQVSPTEVKMASVGKKTASKAEMIEWAASLYPNAPWLTRKLKGQLVLTNANEHLADAVATLHAGVKTDQFAQAASMMRSMLA